MGRDRGAKKCKGESEKRGRDSFRLLRLMLKK